MLRKFLVISLAVFALTACNKKSDQTQPETDSTYTVDKLMEGAELEVGKEVVLKGIVTHVCRHSGKKCFLSDESGNLSMRVMAGGDITSFDQELKGKEIIVKGVLREGERISREDIAMQEQAVNEEMQAAHAHEHGEGCNHGHDHNHGEAKVDTEKKSCCGHNHDEAEVKAEADQHAQHCNSKLNSIKQMQAWMEKNGKDYYALYYIDGTSYEEAK